VTVDKIAQEVARLLSERSEKLVLAESCTCGLIASTLGQIPGISANFCGSAVVYRADSKKNWLGVTQQVIARYTTESPEVSEKIAIGIIENTPEADWSIGIVGHFGPDAPKEKDGIIFLTFVRRTKRGKIKVKERIKHKLSCEPRILRQEEATEVALTFFARLLNKKSK
jgi:nicotinamide-nucleotide amidase